MGGLLWLVVVVDALRISEGSPISFHREGNICTFCRFKSRQRSGPHPYLLGAGGDCSFSFPRLFLRGSWRRAPTLLDVVLVGCGVSTAALIGANCVSPLLPSSKACWPSSLAAALLALRSSFFLRCGIIGFSLCHNTTSGCALNTLHRYWLIHMLRIVVPQAQQVDPPAFVVAIVAAGLLVVRMRDIGKRVFKL